MDTPDVPAYSQVLLRQLIHLRTIIVIADVHRRFGDWREPLPLTFRHWSGVTPYTSPYGFAESCVFGKQSIGIFRCGRHVSLRSPLVTERLSRNTGRRINPTIVIPHHTKFRIAFPTFRVLCSAFCACVEPSETHRRGMSRSYA